MIKLFLGVLSPTECQTLLSRFAWDEHGVIDHDAQDIGALVNERTGLNFRWRNHVTLSMKEVPWHLDSALGASHKVCIYLRPGVGTQFQSGEIVGGGLGDIVVFDISLVHRTAPGGDGERRVLGLRAVDRDDEPTVRTSWPPRPRC